MKKLQIVILVLFAVSAFGAIAVSPAFAEATLLAEWLLSGEKVVSPLPVEGKGEALLEDNSGKAAITCTVTFDGTVEPDGAAEITAMLTSGGDDATLAAPITACKTDPVSECVNEDDIELSPVGLPWLWNLFLMENGQYLLLWIGSGTNGAYGYEIGCLVLGIKVTDTCEDTDGESLVENVTEGVETVGAITPDGKCSIGGNGTEDDEFIKPFIWLATESGRTLANSSE